VAASEFDQPYTLASWDPENVNPDGSTGCVYLNKEHASLLHLGMSTKTRESLQLTLSLSLVLVLNHLQIRGIYPPI
jgi:hypothetical protein